MAKFCTCGQATCPICKGKPHEHIEAKDLGIKEHCAECGAELEPRPRYCSPKCRTKAWRKRQ